MKKWFAFIILFVGGILSYSTFSINGEWLKRGDQGSGSQQSPPAKEEPLERNREEDSAQAFLLLDGVVQKASGWNDAATVRILTRIAQLMWESHPDYSRRLLRQSMDVLIQKIDAERRAPALEQASLLRKVMAVAGQSDPQLAQELAEKYQQALSRREATAPPSKDSSPQSMGSAPAAAQELMAYAASVAAEKPELAARMAGISLRSGISGHLATVVARLLRHKPELSAQVLTAAVNTLDQSQRSTVKDASFIQAWILNEQIGDHLPAEVLAQYVVAAGRIIDRTLSSPALLNASAWDAYFLATQLLPLLDRYAPEQGDLIRSRFADLQRHPEVQREIEREERLKNRPRGPGAVQERLARARSAPTDTEHDTRLISLASDLAWKLHDLEQAMEVLAEVGDAKKQTQFQDVISQIAVRNSLEESNLDEALTWARRIPTLTRRAHALIQIGQRRAESRDAEAALAIVDEARLLLVAEPKTPERALVLLFAAMVYATADPEQGFEMLSQAITASNEAGALQTLELTGKKVVIEDYGFSYHYVLPLPFKVEIDQGFKALTKTDFERALLAAQGFAAKEIRARAVIAVAAPLLQEEG